MENTKKVLIVDDEKFVTDTLEGFFHNRGYSIFKAEDGQACLSIIKSEKPDLVLLDIKLPQVDGIEILRLLRSDYPQAKVVVMTAYDMEYKIMVDSIGCDAFFVKPLLIDELTRKVEELLSMNKIQSQIVMPQAKTKPASLSSLKFVIPEKAFPKARLLIVSPRSFISGLLKDYFSKRDVCNGVYDIAESAIEQLGSIKRFRPDIIILDIALVGILGEFGVTLMKLPQPPKEIILFGDPEAKWEEVETLINRGTKFIGIPPDLHNGTHSIRATIQRLNEAVREVCAKYSLFEGGG